MSNLTRMLIENVEQQKAKTPEETERLRAESEKLLAEKEKLQEEKNSLLLENRALGIFVRRWSPLLSAIGGLTGALLTGLVAIAGWRLKRMQEARLQQEKSLSQSKLEQDKELTREKQTLELYRDLGHTNPRTQFAASSVLLQRLENYQKKMERNEQIDALEELERPTIIKVLVAVIKERSISTDSYEALRKHIADNLILAVGARVDGAEPQERESPLRQFDWQNANLKKVWWKRVDARSVDFYQANLRNAGLAEAFLQGTVFYEADLTDAVLKGAHLEGANFFGAQLGGVNLQSATYDTKTVWPDGFDPCIQGALLSKEISLDHP
jgi:hypothetical protein